MGSNTPGLPPDEWFSVYVEAVLYWAYKYADYDRMGTATVASNGQVQYSGQLGTLMAVLNDMRLAEKLPLGAPWLKQNVQAKG